MLATPEHQIQIVPSAQLHPEDEHHLHSKQELDGQRLKQALSFPTKRRIRTLYRNKNRFINSAKSARR